MTKFAAPNAAVSSFTPKYNVVNPATPDTAAKATAWAGLQNNAQKIIS